MRKKIISIVLAAMMSVSALAIVASAAEMDAAETSSTTGTIKFEDPWNSSAVYFHIWDASNSDEDTRYATKNGWAGNSWGSKKIRGTKVAGEENVWESFEFEIPDGHDIFVIFANADGMQTYDCVINANCFGDTAYTTGETVENPVDSEKTAIVASFKNNSDCGPYLQITSTGKVVGSCTAPSDDPAAKVADYIWNLNGQVDKSGEPCVTPEKVQNALTAFGTDANSVWAKYQERHSSDEGYASKEADAKAVLGVNDNTDIDDTSSAEDTSSIVTSSTTSSASVSSTTSSETSSVSASSTTSSETSSVSASSTTSSETSSVSASSTNTSSTTSSKKNTADTPSSKANASKTTTTTTSGSASTVATGVVTTTALGLIIFAVSGAMVIVSKKRKEQ